MKNKTISIVINARTSSSRIQNKLLRPFCGNNLIGLALDKMLEMKEWNCYFAVADKDLIDFYNKNYQNTNIKLLLRNPQAVTKGFNDYAVAWEHYNRVESSHIFCMNPCLPFIKVETYISAIKCVIGNDEIKTLTSVKSSENLFFYKNKIVNAPTGGMIRTVKNEKMYEMAHAFHIFDKDFFVKNNFFWDYSDNNPYLFEIDRLESFDIDEPVDFIVAEALYEKFDKELDLSHWK